jgi:hypothetical protein
VRTEKEIMLRSATKVLAYLSKEKAASKREWQIEISKYHWKRLCEMKFPICHDMPFSINESSGNVMRIRTIFLEGSKGMVDWCGGAASASSK